MPRKPRIVRPRHATIVAYIALFSALSGSAYAAVRVSGAEILDESIESVDVKDDSLTGADIKYGALTGVNIADSSVKGADIANGSIAGAKVFDGTLTNADLAPGAGIGYVRMYTHETSDNATDKKNRNRATARPMSRPSVAAAGSTTPPETISALPSSARTTARRPRGSAFPRAGRSKQRKPTRA